MKGPVALFVGIGVAAALLGSLIGATVYGIVAAEVMVLIAYLVIAKRV